MNDFMYSDLVIGQTCTFYHQVTQEQQLSFCQMSGDTNPLHLDEAFARGNGYSGCVVYGMLVAALYSTLAGVYLPGRNCLLHSVEVFFTKPVFIGDVLRVEGKVSGKEDLFRRITVKASIYNQSGVKVSRAVIKAGVTHG